MLDSDLNRNWRTLFGIETARVDRLRIFPDTEHAYENIGLNHHGISTLLYAHQALKCVITVVEITHQVSMRYLAIHQLACIEQHVYMPILIA